MALITDPPMHGNGASRQLHGEGAAEVGESRVARWDWFMVPAARVFLVVAICLQFGWGLSNGLWDAGYEYRARIVDVDVLANINKASDLQVYLDVNFWGNVPRTRHLAEIARKYRLSVYDTALISEYQRRGLFCRQATMYPGVRSCLGQFTS